MKQGTIISITLVCMLFLVLFLLSGRYQQKEPTKKDINFSTYVGDIVIEEDPSLEALGLQQTVGGICFIKLKRSPFLFTT